MKGSVKHIEWRKILEFAVIFLALPIAVFFYASKWNAGVLRYAYHFLLALFLVQALTFAAYWHLRDRRRNAPRAGMSGES